MKSPQTLAIKKEGSATSKSSKSGKKAGTPGRSPGSPLKRKASSGNTPTRKVEKALRVDSSALKKLPKIDQQVNQASMVNASLMKEEKKAQSLSEKAKQEASIPKTRTEMIKY